MSCLQFSQAPWNACTNSFMSLQGVLFAQACKKTCNLCNIQQTTTSISSLGCQNLQGFDSTCNYFTQAQFNNSYCTNNQAFVYGVLFSVTCQIAIMQFIIPFDRGKVVLSNAIMIWHNLVKFYLKYIT